MVKQHTDNIFKISIGRIDKAEEVKIKIYYIDKFEIVDNCINVLIPTLVTPRYKSEITQNLTYGRVDYDADVNINIENSSNIGKIECISHPIDIIHEENNICIKSSN